MTAWTPEEQLAFDIAFALKNVTIPGFRKALNEEDRCAIAQTIAAHLKLAVGSSRSLRSQFNKNKTDRVGAVREDLSTLASERRNRLDRNGAPNARADT